MKALAASSDHGPKVGKSQIDNRKAIRKYELEQVIKRLPKNASILEIGAGAGWQAKELTTYGFSVQAIDIPESNYSKIREWDVISYDGNTIPFPDSSFDVVFSSNVLEHIPHVKAFQKEILRVLKGKGIAIHVMPSTIWRTLTFLNFYPDRIKKLAQHALKFATNSRNLNSVSEIERIPLDKKSRTVLQKALTMLIPPRHGETGSAISELYLFSSHRWKQCFEKTGWRVREICPAGLLYSGQKLFGSLLKLSTRESLAKVFGSSCTIFVLEKNQE